VDLTTGFPILPKGSAMNELLLTPIAYIETDFKDKFGIPRQSGRVKELTGRIVFVKEGFHPESIRGLEEFSHLWLIWGFSKAGKPKGATVRPPRLGGNKRMGVFATRSPYRPNPIGLSCVKLEKIQTEGGSVSLLVSGVDLLDGTPIYDVKPYLPFADAHPEALGGFAAAHREHALQVHVPEHLLALLPKDKQEALLGVLKDDPRPSYQNDERSYGMRYAGFEVTFFVKDNTDLTVTRIEKEQDPKSQAPL
jgi:tRNA-Thr(GGU) m(6)t(6)A37 methyltransferase TsaA